MKRILSLIMVFAIALSLFACGGNSNSADTKYIKEKGTFIVGITDFEPMDFKNAKGEWIGFDADLAKEFADFLGVKVEFKEIDWDNKVLELNNKNIDCVWNGMTLTDAVMKAMSCSSPYCDNAQVIVVKSSDEDLAADIDNLAKFKFAVEAGSAGEDAAKANGFNYTAVQSQADTLLEVSSGTSNAAIIDLLMASAMIGEGTSYPDLVYTGRLTREEYGVGFRKGSDLVERFNAWYLEAARNQIVNNIASKYGIQDAVK